MTLVAYALVALSAVVCAGAYCLARLSEIERTIDPRDPYGADQ